jgi:hypothetical protein
MSAAEPLLLHRPPPAALPPYLAELSPPFRSQGTLRRVVVLAALPVVFTAGAVLLMRRHGRVDVFWAWVLLWWLGFGIRLVSEVPFWRRGLAPTSDERFSWIDFPHRRAAYERALDTVGPWPRRWRYVADSIYALAAIAFALWYLLEL